jgi:adenylate cyclase
VVDFDDRSLRALHTSLPLPRRLQAQMIDRLRRAGARVIAYDFEFGPVKHGDATLHRAIGQAGGRLVLASLHFADDGRLILFRRPQQEGVVAYAGFPLDRIGGPGSPAVYRRMDARVRLAPDVLQVPTFWYLVARKAGLKVAPWRDPVAIDYRNDVKTIPAIDVLTGRTGAASLRGKVVVVGTSSASAGDLHATPTRARVPGVQILASAILTTATHARDAARDIVLIFLLALIPVACLWLAAPYAVAAVVLAAAAYLALAQVAYDRGHVLPVAVPLAALAVSALGMVAARLLMPDEPSRGRSVR